MKIQWINNSLHIKVGEIWFGFYPLAFVGYRDHWAKWHFWHYKSNFQFAFGPFDIQK